MTPKERQEGNFLNLVIPQLTVIVLTITGLIYGTWRVFTQDTGSEIQNLIVNFLWGLNNVFAMLPMVRAAFWKPENISVNFNSQKI